MRSSTPSPSFLVRNRYSYCFRIRVPNDLQSMLRKTELRYSLKTGYLMLAKMRSRILAGLFQKLFLYLRGLKNDMRRLSDDEVTEIIEHCKDVALSDYQEVVDSKGASDDSQRSRALAYEGLISIIARLKMDLRADQFNWIETYLDDYLGKHLPDFNPDSDKTSHQYKQLCRKAARSAIEVFDQEKSFLDYQYSELGLGNLYDQRMEPSDAADKMSCPSQDNTSVSSKLISEVVDPFIAENKVNWEPKTEGEVIASLNLFIEWAGDVPIQSVNRATVANYKDVLRKLPPNKSKAKEYRDKTIPELMVMDIKKALSVERVNKHLQRVGALFDYAIRHGQFAGPNPATKMQLPKNKKARDKRAAFTGEELERLFRSDEYQKDTFKKSYMFWTPILALFHGMRQNEIAGLLLDDIRKSEDGIWTFNLTERDLKTAAANRIVPIHPFVLDDLNFLKRVDQLRNAGHVQLFPELKKTRDGYGKYVSRWFNDKYKTNCGIDTSDGRMRDFHSFRATFITHLRHKKVHDRELKAVVGHSVDESVTDSYTEDYPPQQLLEDIISRVDFNHQLDLSHLTKSKWVVK